MAKKYIKLRANKLIMARDTSNDGFKNKLETIVLTKFKPIWDVIQSNEDWKKKANKFLINSSIYKIPCRPYPYSMMTLEEHIPDTDIPKKPDTYSSWDSLTDRTYSGRHLPPDFEFNKEGNLPKLEDLAVLFKKKGGKTIYSEKSTLLFPYWVQWFTDGFLRTDIHNRLKNTSNHHIDLCSVYGLTRKSTHMLRSFQGGKLKSQMINGEEYPHFYYQDPENNIVKPEFEGLYEPLHEEKRQSTERKAKLFAMGVERANVQLGYVMLNVLCLREHNRICDVLAKNYSEWDDERLFQTARNILTVLVMKIVIDEYINHITPYQFKFITDPLAFTDEKWYRLNWMTTEFSLVYRWHSALAESLTYDGKEITMFESLWNNDLLINKGLGANFEETSTQAATKIGLFNTAEFLIPVELKSIELGRQSKLANYNDYREMCNYPRVTDFNQITGDEDAQKLLKDLYGDVEKVEFYVGLYAEDVRENSALPPLIGRLVGIDAFSQALTNPLLAENLFNADTFSPIGLKIIEETNTVSELVHRNIPKDKEYDITFYLK